MRIIRMCCNKTRSSRTLSEPGRRGAARRQGARRRRHRCSAYRNSRGNAEEQPSLHTVNDRRPHSRQRRV